jgi:sugar phosphate isomerase/epimerase
MRDLARDLSLLSINTATLKTLTLRQAVETLSRHGIRTIAPWRDRIAECGVKDAARILADHDMGVSGLIRAGMFTSGDAALDDNRRAVDEAAAINARCLVLVAGGLAPQSRDLAAARGIVRDGMGALLPYARAAGVALAIEPLHPMYAADRACINTLAQANDLCDALGSGLGIAIDVYHTWWDPALEAEIARAGQSPGRILAFHICDWLVPTTDLLLDRGMMGDGVIDIRRIRGWVEDSGYTGPCEVEIFSAENWWKRDADEVVRICGERFQSCC